MSEVKFMKDDDEEMVHISGLRITPDSLTDGKWVGEDGLTCDITALSFTVPDCIEGGPYEEQKVMAVLNAKQCYTLCPHCRKTIPEETIVLMLEEFHILPALCCGNMVWIRNGGSKRFLDDMV